MSGDSNGHKRRIFDVVDKRVAFQQFLFAAGVAVGTSFISIGASFFATSGSIEPNRQGVFVGLSIEYAFLGSILLLASFIAAHLAFNSRTPVKKQRFRFYSPKTQDNFVVVIEGIGSHGDAEKETGVDNILENAVERLLANKNSITSARFYSANGVRNLLKQQL
jgi:hypothetical protein